MNKIVSMDEMEFQDTGFRGGKTALEKIKELPGEDIQKKIKKKEIKCIRCGSPKLVYSKQKFICSVCLEVF